MKNQIEQNFKVQLFPVKVEVFSDDEKLLEFTVEMNNGDQIDFTGDKQTGNAMCRVNGISVEISEHQVKAGIDGVLKAYQRYLGVSNQ